MAEQISLLIGPSAELHTKSPRTRRRFMRVLRSNLRSALRRESPGTVLVDDGRRLLLRDGDLDEAAAVASRAFGVHRVARVRELREGPLDELAAAVAELARPAVTGHTFAVRVARRGGQRWRSMDAERQIGSLLLDSSAGVNLTRPEVTVRIDAYGDIAYVEDREWRGPGGLPMGTQAGALALFSGGFDSPVAAWMLMRRGVPVHFVHFQLDCAATDHAAIVAYELWRRWGAGSEPSLWIVDFQPIKDAIVRHVHTGVRQVVLKQLMFKAADLLAGAADLPALVTGEAVAQVSSQTLHHLALIDRACQRTVLRPLAGLDKQDIIDWSRRIGTHDLSARATEVCDLSGDRVAVAAPAARVDAALGALPEQLVPQVVTDAQHLALSEWLPGMEVRPAAAAVPLVQPSS